MSGEREERYRLAAAAASVPLLLIASPLFLPVFNNKSFLDQRGMDSGVIAAVCSVLGWPVLVGAMGLRAARLRRAPGTVAFAVPALVHVLGAIGTAFLILIMRGQSYRARESPATLVAGAGCLVMVYLLGRGFRRAGWERWGQLVAGVWMLHAVWTTLILAERHGPFDVPEVGAWVYLFAVSAAVPAVGWMLWPKRRS